jgi:formylglycine-generating enzyme required for sulfatase activity
VHDVTQGQWQAVMGENPSYFSRFGGGQRAVKGISDEELKLFPVESVSWNDVQEFLKKLNKKMQGRGYLYRLPSATEWEYACRNGATSEEECSNLFYFDEPTNALSSEQANFNGEHPFGKAPKGKWLQRTSRVGAYPPNKLGLCDMHGNVWQWTDTDGVYRGGSWYNFAWNCRAAARGKLGLSKGNFYTGVRLARVSVR